ncbi:hypothetical protein BHM03_00031538, partial [Ensete ventricosum]
PSDAEVNRLALSPSPFFSLERSLPNFPVAAAVCRAGGEPLQIEEVVVAPPKAYEVRIKIICTSLCHSDITIWSIKVSSPPSVACPHRPFPSPSSALLAAGSRRLPQNFRPRGRRVKRLVAIDIGSSDGGRRT